MRKHWMIVWLVVVSLLGGAAMAEVERSLRFKVYTWYDELRDRADQVEVPQLYYRVSAERYVPIELSHSQVSVECKTKLTDALILFERHVNAEGEESYEPAVSAKLSKATKQAFVYLFPFEGKLAMMVVDTGEEAIPSSSMLFINRSQKPVVVELNGKKVEVGSLKKGVISYRLGEQKTLRLKVVEQGKSRPLSVMTVGAREGQRLIGLFYPVRQGRYRVLIEREVDDQSILIAQ
ncbi:hypothetical protein [Rubritalea tangerina]|uniref:DUF3108 domain-containing protein n=1 Tax=Rubritalea tangerina TaxID=430798 RepID=A0ABW4ZFD7_9BACT